MVFCQQKKEFFILVPPEPGTGRGCVNVGQLMISGEPLVKTEQRPVWGVSVVFLTQPDGNWEPAPRKHFLSLIPIDSDSQREV